jgi:hypothetical protein
MLEWLIAPTVILKCFVVRIYNYKTGILGWERERMHPPSPRDVH